MPLNIAVCWKHFDCGFIYSILNYIVKKLKLWSKSAGNQLWNFKENLLFYIVGTSETLRYGIKYFFGLFQFSKARNDKTERINRISQHVTTHLKPINHEFGHYLSGLIEGDGHFSKQKQLIIVFNHLDISLAYFIKSRLGCGTVKKVKSKKAVLFILSNKQGIMMVLNLINGNLKTKVKLNQIIENILPYYPFELNTNLNPFFNNSWLAGFSDADASFQIKILEGSQECFIQTEMTALRSKKVRKEVRLNFQIDQKGKEILCSIKDYLGGNIGFRKNQDTYYYGSTSFGSARKVIHYFDKYHLQSTKYLNYLKWRKAYLIIQEKDPLNEVGFQKLTKLKKTMNRSGEYFI